MRAAVLAESLASAPNFTDHMVSIEWTSKVSGWHDADRRPSPANLLLDPACAVLHYAQEIFEGLKAYKQADGGIALFRPQANAARFNAVGSGASPCRRCPRRHVHRIASANSSAIDRDVDPDGQPSGSSLYLRPFMFASEAFLGVRPAQASTNTS